MTRACCRSVILVVLCTIVASSRASAQNVIGDVAGGYSALSSSTGGLPFGWFGSAGFNFNDNFGIAGEVSGNYRSTTDDITGVTASRHEHSFLAGPRLVLVADKQTVYAHFLIGVANASITSVGTFGRTTISTSTTDTVICYEPGLGVDLEITDKTTFRVEVNFRSLKSNGSVAEFQFIAGVARRFR